MALEDIQEIPKPGSDPNWMTDWRNWKKVKAIIIRGLMQQFSISEDLAIPSGSYIQMVNPIVEAGVLVTVEAGGLWFADA